jgi:hypothetical protein
MDEDNGEVLEAVIEENEPEPEVVEQHFDQEFKEMKVTKIVLLNKFEQLPTVPRNPKSKNPVPSRAASHTQFKRIIVSKDPIKKEVFREPKVVVLPKAKTNTEVHPVYVCELCGKEVKRKARYIEHMNTHTNSRVS